ncbi:hypothetical protein [Nigerium sp.]|uniref:hypothetical protein n=1 Tax=Nigerium sp. TaxID=2042655 RepID=UPI003221684D
MNAFNETRLREELRAVRGPDLPDDLAERVVRRSEHLRRLRVGLAVVALTVAVVGVLVWQALGPIGHRAVPEPAPWVGQPTATNSPAPTVPTMSGATPRATRTPSARLSATQFVVQGVASAGFVTAGGKARCLLRDGSVICDPHRDAPASALPPVAQACPDAASGDILQGTLAARFSYACAASRLDPAAVTDQPWQRQYGTPTLDLGGLRAAVLPQGSTLRFGDVSCTATAAGGVRCTNRTSGNGFTSTARGFRVTGPQASEPTPTASGSTGPSTPSAPPPTTAQPTPTPTPIPATAALGAAAAGRGVGVRMILLSDLGEYANLPTSTGMSCDPPKNPDAARPTDGRSWGWAQENSNTAQWTVWQNVTRWGDARAEFERVSADIGYCAFGAGWTVTGSGDVLVATGQGRAAAIGRKGDLIVAVQVDRPDPGGEAPVAQARALLTEALGRL